MPSTSASSARSNHSLTSSIAGVRAMKDRFPAGAQVQSSRLGTDEFIEPGDGFAASDRDGPAIHAPPRDVENVEVLAEDLADIRRAVAELVARIRVDLLAIPNRVE